MSQRWPPPAVSLVTMETHCPKTTQGGETFWESNNANADEVETEERMRQRTGEDRGEDETEGRRRQRGEERGEDETEGRTEERTPVIMLGRSFQPWKQHLSCDGQTDMDAGGRGCPQRTRSEAGRPEPASAGGRPPVSPWQQDWTDLRCPRGRRVAGTSGGHQSGT